MKRRICWPDFDKVCLEGGCLYCEDNPIRDHDMIMRAAEKRGLLAAFRAGTMSGRRWKR